MLGTVKFFERHKGWGYITPDDAAIGDVYVHEQNTRHHLVSRLHAHI